MKSPLGMCAWCSRYIFVVSIFGFFAPTTVHASMNCAGKLSPSEEIICKDPWLQELDDRLNKAYSRAIKVAHNKQAFIHDQQEWLRTTRDRCTDYNCLNLAYLPRIEKLITSYELNKDLYLAKTQGIDESNLSDQEGKDVCASLAKFAGNGHINELAIQGRTQETLEAPNNVEDGWLFTQDDENKIQARKSLFLHGGSVTVIYKLLLRNNGEPVRFASFYSWGAEQSSSQVFNLSIIEDPDNEDNGIDVVAGMDVDDTRWAHYGGTDKPIFYHGRYYLFTESDLASMVSWVRPDGRTRPICFWYRSEEKP